jgi:hypothetical protein
MLLYQPFNVPRQVSFTALSGITVYPRFSWEDAFLSPKPQWRFLGATISPLSFALISETLKTDFSRQQHY